MFKLLKIEKKIFFGFGFLFLLGIFLRFFKLNAIPVSLYYDEMDYVINGESLGVWGSDLSGSWSPNQLQPIRTLNYTAELPEVFHAIIFSFFGSDNIHATSALFGFATICVVAVIIYVITKRWDITLVTATTITVNPWYVFISRMGYEAVISIFFQICFIVSVWFFVHSVAKFKFQIISAISAIGSLFFAYYTYHGAKITMVGLVFACVVWTIYRRSLIKRSIFFLVILVSSLFLLLKQTHNSIQSGQFGSRESELISMSYASSLVDEYRQKSLAFPGSEIFINKFSVLFRELGQRYVSVFDIYRLVGSGYESGFQFSLIVHGYFYFSSLLFFIPGFMWWYKKYPEFARYLTLILFFSPIASVVTIGYQSVFRSGLTYVILLIFIGGGIFYFHEWFKKHHYSLFFHFFIWILLLTEVLYFGYSYFSRYPIASADNHSFSEKLLAGYVGKLSLPATVIVDDYPYNKARSILFYNHDLSELSESERKQFANPSSSTYVFDDFETSDICPTISNFNERVYIVSPGKFKSCGFEEFLATRSAVLRNESEHILLPTISSPIDSGAYYYVLNDPMCSLNDLAQFVHNTKIEDFNSVKLTEDEYCEKWMKVEMK